MNLGEVLKIVTDDKIVLKDKDCSFEVEVANILIYANEETEVVSISHNSFYHRVELELNYNI